MQMDLDLRHIQRSDLRIAVIGATGMVGMNMLKVLAITGLKPAQLLLVASARSVGQTINWQGKDYPVMDMQEAIAAKPHIALFAADNATATTYAPQFAAVGTKVIDNSSAFRMNPDMPLVIPEVNIDAILPHHNIIANPNCSTIQMVVALAPLHKLFGLKRIVVSTYQAVSGTGVKAIQQYNEEKQGQKATDPAYWHPIFENCLPQCDSFVDEGTGYTKEEMKLINETKKILALPNLGVTATAVRIPVLVGHSESVNASFEKDFSIAQVREVLSTSPSVILMDEPQTNTYPMPIDTVDKHDVFVGRLRKDMSMPNTLNMWIVADNLMKGAATNAVQIAKYLLENNMIMA